MPFFNSFQLDVPNASLRRGKQAIFLAPKAFRVLQYLVEHCGQLVSKDDLFRAVWPGIAVTDATLAVCLSQIRKALGDEPKNPRYIETVHRLGYRFIATVSDRPVRSARSRVGRQASPSVPLGSATIIVGRDAEFAQVRSWYAEMLSGRRQVLFVAGEAGIGKTTLVQSFLESIDTGNTIGIGRGQCIEQYGSREPYMPVLEALTRIASGGTRPLELLKKFAPSWVVQLPGLLSADERKQLQSETQGVTQLRMLREMAHGLEALAAESPLVLVLEDLHWSDFSTLELISAIARRTEPARLMVVGTYRPVEMLASDHPLLTVKAELELHRQCNELRLKLLSKEDVAEYLAKRSANDETWQASDRVAPMIHARTEGNPLFMVNVVDYLIEQGLLRDPVKIDAPRTIQQLIEHNLQRLHPEEQRALEVASVVGTEFSAAAVAAALERPLREVEESCIRLARHEQFVDEAGVAKWPDGTVASRFRFHHTLYADLLYSRITAGHRVELHRRIAERKEAAYGEHASEFAAELARHWTEAGETEQASAAWTRTGKAAESRHAFKEAQQNYEQALALLSLLPESAERDLYELKLRQSIIRMLSATTEVASPQSVDAYARAIALAEKSGNLSQLVSLMHTRGCTAFIAGDYESAATLADHALELAERESNPTILGLVHHLQVMVRYSRGDLAGAEEHFARGLKFFEDPAIWPLVRLDAFGFASVNAWMLGRANLARDRLARLITTTNQNNPAAVAWSGCLGAVSYHRLGEHERAEMLAAQALELSKKHHMPHFAQYARCVLGWTRAELGHPCEGVALIRQGIASMAEIGLHHDGYTLFLAQSQALSGAIGDALETIEQVLQPNHPDANIFQLEAFCLRGELQTKQGRREAAEADFCTALTLARSMGAKALELRATMNLGRLLRDSDRRDEARTMLAEIYNWFTEGFDTADLKDAKALLDELSE